MRVHLALSSAAVALFSGASLVVAADPPAVAASGNRTSHTLAREKAWFAGVAPGATWNTDGANGQALVGYLNAYGIQFNLWATSSAMTRENVNFSLGTHGIYPEETTVVLSMAARFGGADAQAFARHELAAALRPGGKVVGAKVTRHYGAFALTFETMPQFAEVYLGVASTAKTSTGTTVSHRQLGKNAKSFEKFLATVEHDLSFCNAGAEVTQIQLGMVLAAGAKATQGEVVQLDTYSKDAQTRCDMVKDQAVLNLGNLNVPSRLGWIKALANITFDAQSWATDDTTAVLHDIQRLVESNGNSVALDAQLQSDVAQANHDAASLNGRFRQAAKRLHLTFKGLGLVKW